jgi:hypothetical protein
LFQIENPNTYEKEEKIAREKRGKEMKKNIPKKKNNNKKIKKEKE